MRLSLKRFTAALKPPNSSSISLHHQPFLRDSLCSGYYAFLSYFLIFDMAEAVAVVGVVASGVSLASFALQLLDTVVKLRRLWTDIKDAPEEVIELLSEIEVLAGLLGTIKDVHTPMPGNAMFDAIFNCQRQATSWQA
jgi:hypothetical protein